MEGFIDEETGKVTRGYKDICNEIVAKFPDPTEIFLEADKKEFVQLFGELLKSENILKNFDEVNRIKELYEEVAEELYLNLKDKFIIEISQLNIWEF